jgi:hypothetical protein
MIPDIRCWTLFCEDIREEKGGTDSLVGVLLDNIEVPVIPTALPKLGMYTRLGFSLSAAPDNTLVLLRYPDGREQQLAEFSKERIEKEIEKAKTSGAPFAGFVSRGRAVPFPIAQTGRLLVVVKSSDTEIVSGHLNVKIKPPTDSSASLPPS